MANLKVIFFTCITLVSCVQFQNSFAEVASSQYTNRPLDFYNNILKAYQNHEWKSVIFNADSLIKKFPSSPFAAEASYYRGVAYFSLSDYDMANLSFSNYLKNEATPKFFEEAIEYKFKIGVKFKEGAKRHLMGLNKLPRIVPAKDEAIEIFDLVVTSLPRHDIAAEALYHKAALLMTFRDYQASVEAFQTLIRRFPKHPLAPEGFLGIGKVYLNQSIQEFPDHDVLSLAEVNVEKFKEAFPAEPRLEDANKMLDELRSVFAKELFDVGSFFVRTKKFDAAEVYFTNLIKKYPTTRYARKAEEQLKKIESKKIQLDKKKKG